MQMQRSGAITIGTSEPSASECSVSCSIICRVRPACVSCPAAASRGFPAAASPSSPASSSAALAAPTAQSATVALCAIAIATAGRLQPHARGYCERCTVWQRQQDALRVELVLPMRPCRGVTGPPWRPKRSAAACSDACYYYYFLKNTGVVPR